MEVLAIDRSDLKIEIIESDKWNFDIKIKSKVHCSDGLITIDPASNSYDCI
jgi:hypothetical protein